MGKLKIDNVLNLNDRYGYLIANRKAALKPIISQLSVLKPGQDAIGILRKYERYCNAKNADGEYPEYVGIMRWFIARQIRKHM